MKFAEYLREHLTSEWCSQYIAYDEMKILLTESVIRAQQLPQMSVGLTREEFLIFADTNFFQFCEEEALKINNFFAEKLAEALRRLEPLKNELGQIKQKQKHVSSSMTSPIVSDEVNICENVSDGSRRSLNQNNGFLSWWSNVQSKQLIERSKNNRIERKRYRKVNDLKLAFSEFYLMLVLLKNYQTLNFTGFRKILKKHDKLFKTTRGDEWRKVHIDSTPFHKSRQVDQLINEVETIYTNVLEFGNRARTMQRLRVPPLEEKQSLVVTFRIGMFVGMLCLLIPMVIIFGINFRDSRSGTPFRWRESVHLYRPSFLIILHILLFGVNIYGWSYSGVNHVLIFEIDPRNHLTYHKFLELGTFLMCMWCLSFSGYILSSYYHFQPYIQPLSFSVFIILFLINPTRTFYHNARFWFLKMLGRVFVSPFYHVGFADFFLGDQLTSLELVFFDIEYFICFYIYDSKWDQSKATRSLFCSGWSQYVFQTVLIILPSWFRFAQCLRRYRDTENKFPHLVNAGKYASTFFVVITNSFRRATTHQNPDDKARNPFFYLWIITSFISSTYKLIWDLKMDWGFFDKYSDQNKFLRGQIIYPYKIYYYAAIVEDLIFRYIWIINIFIYFETPSAEYADVIGFIFGIIEVFRRFIWNFFRLENEHLNNCGDFGPFAIFQYRLHRLKTIVR